MRQHNFSLPSPIPHFKMHNIERPFKDALINFLLEQQVEKRNMKWLPEYDEVISWLTDNEQKGLLLYGTCGLGKTIIAKYCIPYLLIERFGIIMQCIDAVEMHKYQDVLRSKKAYICIDDFGTETEMNDYGTKRELLSELLDSAEKEGKLLVLTTNLNANEIRERYGTRTFDRIVATTKRIKITGISLRK